MKNFDQKNQSIIKIWRNITFLVLFAVLSACDALCGVGGGDCGCIDAEDFGEYEQTVLEIRANQADRFCSFDSSRLFDSPQQPEGLHQCLSGTGGSSASREGFLLDPSDFESEKVIVADSCKGYESFGDIVLQQCIDACIFECQESRVQNINSSTVFWEATSGFFSIPPFSEIHISAVGAMDLLESETKDPILVQPREFNLQTTINKDFFVKRGSDQTLNFSGGWTDGADSGNDTDSIFGENTDTISVTTGARRLVAVVDPLPQGFLPNTVNNVGRENVLGTPFLIDNALWDCQYDAIEDTIFSDTSAIQSDLLHDELSNSTCNSRAYDSSNGYDNLAVDSNTLHNGIYEVSSNKFMPNLGTVGGFVRFEDDGITSFDNEPFITTNVNNVPATRIKCRSNGSCDEISSGFPASGILIRQSLDTENIESPDDPYEYVNNTNHPVAVSFINIYEGNGCDGENALSITHEAPGVGIIAGIENKRIDIDQNWENNEIFILEPQDKIIVGGVTLNTTDYDLAIGAQQNGKDIIIGLIIESNDDIIAKADVSGLSSYRILNDPNEFFDIDDEGNIILTDAGSTNVENGNITIGTDAITIKHESDNCGKYYAHRVDKIHQITIAKSGNVSFTNVGNSAIAVDECSLDVAIVNPNGTRNNGFYEYYHKDGNNYPDDPKRIYSDIDNIDLNISSTRNTTDYSLKDINNVTQDFSQEIYVRKGQQIRFLPTSWDGYWVARNDESDSNNYFRKCGTGMAMKIRPRLALLCRGDAIESIENSSCNPSGDDTSCINDACFTAPPGEITDSSNTFCPPNCEPENESNFCFGIATVDSCQRCSEFPDVSSEIEASIDQCYDLENYTGSVLNIPDGSLDDSNIATVNTLINNEGLEKLKTFDGNYGNFEKFSVTSSDLNDIVYRFDGYASAKHDGILKFLILDGTTFSNSDYASNSDYDGNDGYSINPVINKNFFNGEMLEVKLCKELEDIDDENSNTACSGTSANQIEGQPQPVLITGTAPNFEIGSHYIFDEGGTLVNAGNSNADVTLEQEEAIADPGNLNSNFTREGTRFYVHSHEQDVNRIRLAFKIKDPDILNCDISNPQLNQDCSNGNCQGVVIRNPFAKFKEFDEDGNEISLTDNINTICGQNHTIGSGDGDCQKEFYCTNPYANNSGSYRVVIKVKDLTKTQNISSLTDSVITPVVRIMDGGLIEKLDENGNAVLDENGKIVFVKEQGQAERIYKLVIHNPFFQAIVQIVFVLSITFYGIGYLMGVSQFSQSEIISRVIKIGIIYLFIGSAGWEWFDRIFVNFFKEGTDYLAFLMATAFDTNPQIETALANNNFYDKSILFSSVDNVFNIFFAPPVIAKMLGLFFSGWFGWAYMLIVFFAFLLYVYAVANAVLLYLTSQVFISVLFVIGPIFFIFLFFNQTKDMFDKWLGQLIAFSLQQIFLLTTLAFFNMMMEEILKLALGYSVCWNEVLAINVPIRVSILSFWTIATRTPDLGSLSPIESITNVPGMPSLFSILFIWVIASLMKQFVTFMTDLAGTIGGGIRASQLSDGIQAGVGAMTGMAKKTFNKHVGQKIKHQVQRADHRLFNAGELAKKAKDDAEARNQRDFAAKGDAVRKADADWNNHISKGENRLKYDKMSKQDQRKYEKNVRRNSMIKSLGEQGYGKGAAESLIDKKEDIRYQGNNALGYTWAAMRQRTRTGAAPGTSMGDRTTGVSDKQHMKALESFGQGKEADEKRNKLTAARRGGNTRVGVGKGEGEARADRKYAEGLAKKQLKAEGAISSIRTRGLRTKDETQKIEDRTNRLLDEGITKPKLNDAYSIARAMWEHAKASGEDVGDREVYVVNNVDRIKQDRSEEYSRLSRDKDSSDKKMNSEKKLQEQSQERANRVLEKNPALAMVQQLKKAGGSKAQINALKATDGYKSAKEQYTKHLHNAKAHGAKADQYDKHSSEIQKQMNAIESAKDAKDLGGGYERQEIRTELSKKPAQAKDDGIMGGNDDPFRSMHKPQDKKPEQEDDWHKKAQDAFEQKVDKQAGNQAGGNDNDNDN